MNSIQKVSTAILAQSYIGVTYLEENNWAWLVDDINSGSFSGFDMTFALVIIVMYSIIPALVWTMIFSIPFPKKGPLIATIALAAIVFFNPAIV